MQEWMENLRGFQSWHVQKMENILNTDNFHDNCFVLQPVVPGNFSCEV